MPIPPGPFPPRPWRGDDGIDFDRFATDASQHGFANHMMAQSARVVAQNLSIRDIWSQLKTALRVARREWSYFEADDLVSGLTVGPADAHYALAGVINGHRWFGRNGLRRVNGSELYGRPDFTAVCVFLLELMEG